MSTHSLGIIYLLLWEQYFVYYYYYYLFFLRTSEVYRAVQRPFVISPFETHFNMLDIKVCICTFFLSIFFYLFFSYAARVESVVFKQVRCQQGSCKVPLIT